MKKIFKGIGLAAAILAVSSVMAQGLADTSVYAEETVTLNRTITTTGQGAVKVKPDIAYIDVGVRNDNKDAAAAQKENADRCDKLINALKAAGVAAADIQTNGYYMYPQYTYTEKGKETIVGYSVSNTVTITVRDITKVSALIDTAGQSGANVINSVRFSLKDTSDNYDKALEKAYAAALKRAQTLAKAAGKTLGEPITINENGGYYAPVNYAENVMNNSANGVAYDASETPVSAGTLDVSASVTVVFEFGK